MFYSETLLAKTGPLARVWLASNLERKLTKQNVLQSNLENNVKDIIGTGQAPMALRLSGQLLLGVARIYKKKAEYLFHDCTEALNKIKVAFRPGNVDLPATHAHTANPTALILPDTLTELDLFAPLPDPEELLLEPTSSRGPGKDPTLLDFGTSQLLPDSQTPSRRDKDKNRTLMLEEDDLGLDLGLDDDIMGVRSTPLGDDRSIEIGRRAHTPLQDRPSMLEEDDLGLDIYYGNADTTVGRESSIHPPPMANDMPLIGADDDYQMGGMDEQVAAENAAALDRARDAAARRQRDTVSPLSDIGERELGELSQAFELDRTAIEAQDETVVQAAQRVKRRRVLPIDTEIELHSADIKKLQDDRSAITKAPELLPRDPLLLQLMEMQRNGGFVSSIMGDGRMAGWAPELRGVMSIEVVRKAGEKKRKRDSGIDVETGSERQLTPQLELPQEEDEGFVAGPGGDFGGDTTLGAAGDDTGPMLMSDGLQAPPADEEDQEQAYADSPAAPFDTTEAPLLHPSQSGPVSLGTKNAVYLLREHFAPDHPSAAADPPTPSKRTRNEMLFTDICPEQSTSRNDATKMFFELLVLGTKDAIKAEQDNGDLGLPIRVRGKRGLWGDWAEAGASSQEAGGEGEGERAREGQLVDQTVA